MKFNNLRVSELSRFILLLAMMVFSQVQGQELEESDFLAKVDFYKNKLDSQQGVDSLIDYHLDHYQEDSFHKQLEVIYQYFENRNYAAPRSLEIGRRALELSTRPGIKMWDVVHVRVYYADALIKAHQFDRSEALILETQSILNREKQPYLFGKTLLSLGRLNQKKGMSVQAISFYMEALSLGRESDNWRLLKESADQLAHLFEEKKVLEKVIEYSEVAYFWSKMSRDSLLIRESKIELLEAINRPEGKILKKEDFGDIFDYAKEKGNKRLFNHAFALLRSNLTSNDQIDELGRVCLDIFRDDFNELSRTNPQIYLRIRALLSENAGKLDSARYYFMLAEKEIENEANQYMVAHFYQRFAEFNYRTGQIQWAIDYYKQSLSLFSQLKEALRSEQISLALVDIYESLGNYKEAHHYSGIARDNNSAYIARLTREEFTRVELEKEVERQKKVSLEAERRRVEELNAERKKRLAVTGGLGLFFLLSGVIYIQYRVTRKERNRSRKLLLNILPEATAEELIHKGTTTAKSYRNATILLIDIKGFTLISEKLTPEQLVHELDIYFSKFDEIVKHHGLEKIKTIGDAYMAVGGLPDGNIASAVDVIRAAQEILAFVQLKKKEQRYKNVEGFDIRIGINTGHVVAGVVGKDKFQYDIWGDAVNVAARMEQNSQIGKINISKSTFNLVKDQFLCTFRGKVSAKNKGEIDMYFVEEER